MANAVIGALRVNLGLDSAEFSNGLKGAKSRLASFANAAVAAFATVTASAASLAGAIAVGVRHSINEADEMSKAAQKFGVGVEELQRLKHAADLSGVSFEGLGTGVRKLSQNMQEFANGAKNTASKAFDALGISVTDADGKLKSSSQVITEIADKLSRMDDGAEKTAIAMAIFGRSGADLIPLLNAGADGLKSMLDEADALGIVIDGNTARAAEAFNDNLTRIGRTQDGLIIQITAALLPALEKGSEKFLAFASDGERVEQVTTAIGNVFHWVSREVALFAGGVAGLKLEIAGLIEAGSRLKNLDFSGAFEAFNQGQEAAVRLRQEMAAAVDDVFNGTSFSQGQIQRRLDTAFGTAGGSAAEKFVANFENAVKTKSGRAKAALDPIAREAAQIFEQTRSPLEKYQAQIAKLSQLLQAGKIDQETYNRAVAQAQDAFTKATSGADENMKKLQRTGQTMANTIGGSFSSLIDGSQKLSDVLKNVLSQLGNMFASNAFQALFGMFGGGLSLGGGSKDPWSGLRLPTFANGGSILPGGVGGIDSQIVAFRKTPTEQVDVYDPRKLKGGGGSSAEGTSRLQVALSPDLVAQILEQSGQQSIQIVRDNNAARENYRQNGGQF